MNFEKKGGGGEGARGCRKRVMAVVDSGGGATGKQAVMWALTHVANEGDLLTLLLAISPTPSPNSSSSSLRKEEKAPLLANSLASICKACRPEVAVETLVVRGPKLETVLSQVKKLEISVLVLSHRKPSPLSCLMMSRQDDFVEQCIEKAQCLTLAVRKQSKGVGGYLVTNRWQRNFWLLA